MCENCKCKDSEGRERLVLEEPKKKKKEMVREGQGLDWIRNMDSKSKGRLQ